MSQKGLPKLKASPAGGPTIMMTVTSHLTKYGPSGVPNGLVDAQNSGQGRTPCRPHSLIMRDCPISTAMRFPKALRAIRKFKPRTAPLEPKT